MKPESLKIDYDNNVLFYIVDKADEPDYLDRIPEDEREALEKANNEWIQQHLTPKLMSLTGFCGCRMPEVMERTQRRAMLAALPPNAIVTPIIEQEDVDAYKFVVVVVADHDKYEDISLIIRECKKCSKIDFWGDAYMLGGQIAALINDAYTAKTFVTETIGDEEPEPAPEPEAVEVSADSPLGEGAVFEDLDTGKWSEGDVGSADCEPTGSGSEDAEP